MKPPNPHRRLSATIHFRTDADTDQMAREIAKREAGSVGALIRRLIRAEYQRQERLRVEPVPKP